MADLFDNPAGLEGFEFIEFSAPKTGILEPVMEQMGFTKVAHHRTKKTALWRQGEINLITNYEPGSQADFFAREHGPGACAMGFRVRDARKAMAYLLQHGAEPVPIASGPMELNLPAIRAVGGALIYLIDRYSPAPTIYDIDFEYIDGVDPNPAGVGLREIDHLTHNLYEGRIAYWTDYYARLFNFQEIRLYDIKGEYTGLSSKALMAPDGKIRIPLNEEGEGGKGQINEYLRDFGGEGIQHIAFSCEDLYTCWDRLNALGVPFMTAPPDTYYDMLDERLSGHGEDTAGLKARGILMDGTTAGERPRLLLQIFSQTQLGPVFFEFIQRKGDDGFGEGNIKALFESVERDQIQRGTLSPVALARQT